VAFYEGVHFASVAGYTGDGESLHRSARLENWNNLKGKKKRWCEFPATSPSKNGQMSAPNVLSMKGEERGPPVGNTKRQKNELLYFWFCERDRTEQSRGEEIQKQLIFTKVKKTR